MRYLLDTNVVSELRKGPVCAPGVAGWARSVESADLALSVLVPGEIRHGIEVLRRRGDGLQADLFSVWLERLKSEFADRMISVTTRIAERWSELRGLSPAPPIDGLMAATAIEYDLTFVTRDAGPLAGTGVRLLDPWGD